MKIIFNLRSVGLGNNGGSSTLIKSGNTLVDMGHEVYFIDSMRNQHKWTPLKAKHIIVGRKNDKIPDADVIIATGYKSVSSTVNAPDKCGIKAHWIRAWETWQMDDRKIVDKILKKPTVKIVNSICLQKKLKSYGFDSYIIRPGYDFGQIFPSHERENRKIVTIGGLYREGVHGRRKRTAWLFETARYMKTKYKNVRFWLFGSEAEPNRTIVDKYVRNPSINEKHLFYNNVDIWLAPTMSEGLHLPPAEAMMTECPVVATKAELSGVQDYIIDGKTGILADNNLDAFNRAVEKLYLDEKLRKKYGKTGFEIIRTIGDRKKNMQKLVELIEELK